MAEEDGPEEEESAAGEQDGAGDGEGEGDSDGEGDGDREGDGDGEGEGDGAGGGQEGLWFPVQAHVDNGKALRSQVSALLKNHAVKIKEEKRRKINGVWVPTVLVYCRHHVSSNGELCGYRHLFVLEKGQVIQYGDRMHESEFSSQALRKIRKAKAERMASSPTSASAQARQAVANGSTASELPSPRSVWRRREDSRRDLRSD
eukprot:8711776-Karenia_brevis.AAC.1